MDATPDERAHAHKLSEEAAAIEARPATTNRPDGMKAANRVANTLATIGKPDRPAFGSAAGSDGDSLSNGHAIKSAGAQFVEDGAYGDWIKSMAPSGDGSFPRIKFQSNPFLIQ